MTKLKVLIACEYSGLIRNAFVEKGHEAYSCDILDTQTPGNHIKDDVLNHLNKDWDLMIANPPCTHLAVSGARWFKDKNQKQKLKNLSKLVATHPLGPEPLFNKDADKGEFVIHGGKKMPKWYSNKERNRDMSFPGMAKAMANQWG